MLECINLSADDRGFRSGSIGQPLTTDVAFPAARSCFSDGGNALRLGSSLTRHIAIALQRHARRPATQCSSPTWQGLPAALVWTRANTGRGSASTSRSCGFAFGAPCADADAVKLSGGWHQVCNPICHKLKRVAQQAPANGEPVSPLPSRSAHQRAPHSPLPACRGHGCGRPE